jgi:hypothetical protein
MSYEKRRLKFLEENRKERLKFITLLATKIRETDFSNDLKNQLSKFLNSQIENSNNFWLNQKKENTKYFKQHFGILK